MIQDQEQLSTTPTSAPDDARLDRAHATLMHTSRATANDWLWELTKRNLRRIDARRVLAAEIEERELLRYRGRRMERIF